MGLKRLEKITRAYVIAFTYRVNIVINEGSQDGFKEVREDNKSIRHCFYIPC